MGGQGKTVELFLRDYVRLSLPWASSLTKVDAANGEGYFSSQSPGIDQESPFLFENSAEIMKMEKSHHGLTHTEF